MIEFVVFLLIVVGIVAFSVVSRRAHQRRAIRDSTANDGWRSAALAMGLTLKKDKNGTQMAGLHGGRVVKARLRTVTRDIGWERKIDRYTQFEAMLAAPAWADVVLSRRGFTAGLARFSDEEQDVEIGNWKFDEGYQIQGELTQELRDALMRPDLRSEIENLWAGYAGFAVVDGTLRVKVHEHVLDAPRVQLALDTMVEHAMRLDRAVMEDSEEELRTAEEMLSLARSLETGQLQEADEEPIW